MTNAEIEQVESIFKVLTDWCKAEPDRRVTLRHDGVQWRATMTSAYEHSGESITDVLGQAATVAALGGS